VRNQATKSARLQVIAIVIVVFAGLGVILWQLPRGPGLTNDYIDFSKPDMNSGPNLETPSPGSTSSSSSSPATTGTLEPPPDASTDSDETATTSAGNTQPGKDATLGSNFVGTLKLIIPVDGVKPDQLLDTFTDARSEGRVHDAIDIPAAAGTQVLAAADGEIVKLFPSERGGTTIYQFSADKKLVFYYAHLQRYADGLVAGKYVRQGDVIGFVGDTGNAGAGNYHLHFSVLVIADPKRYWEGTNINPYPLLRK
jgi:murein DD-endopeptidase MepM/ murein hydrolase activator NlpD